MHFHRLNDLAKRLQAEPHTRNMFAENLSIERTSFISCLNALGWVKVRK